MNGRDINLSLMRKAIKDLVKEAIQRLQSSESTELELEGFKVYASWYPMLSLLEPATAFSKVGEPLTKFVDILQGVTWGGKGAEKVFVLNEEDVKRWKLEPDIVYRCIGGDDIERWCIKWKRKCLLFPYVVRGEKWSRAFEVEGRGITEPTNLKDSLDFESPIDDVECKVLHQGLPESERIKRMLEHRIALGLVRYPNAATYLIQHYQLLRGRTFEGKTLSQYGKMWYEYHRPRVPTLTYKPKIVGPRLMKTAKFALDTHGYLPRDSVIAIVPKRGAFEGLVDSLEKVLGRKPSEEEALMYVLAFLNSEIFNRLLAEKISKKRGGYPIVNEELLQRLSIPLPTEADRDTCKRLLRMVKTAVSQGANSQLDKEINELVKKLYQGR